jgi:hypothetical protein
LAQSQEANFENIFSGLKQTSGRQKGDAQAAFAFAPVCMACEADPATLQEAKDKWIRPASPSEGQEKKK